MRAVIVSVSNRADANSDYAEDATVDPLGPNATTIEAMKEARRGGLKSFASIEDLMADLNAGD